MADPSYSFTTDLSEPLNAARFALGDTESPWLLSDEQVQAALDEYDVLLGTAVLAEGLAAKYAQEPVRLADDGSSIDFSARVGQWNATAARYRTEAKAEADADAATARVAPLPFSGAVRTITVW